MPQLLEVNASDRSIIEWDSFSIGTDETVSFLQPTAASIVLNRVVGQDLSEIFGTLKANGIVYLINPRGILIGENGLIDTASFLASTLDLSNDAFLQGQELLLQGVSEAPFIQLGTIEAREGDVLVMAHHVRNEGSIQAKEGSVSLTAGHEILLKSKNQPLLNIRPDLQALGIENSGVIEALSVYLQSHSLSTLALQQKADITLVEEGGKILLCSEGGPIHIDSAAHLSAPEGTIQVRIEPQEESKPVYLLGSLDVSGKRGGTIEITAPKLLNAGVLNADGIEVGGSIRVSIAETVIETASAQTTASGGNQGGTIAYDSSRLFSSGSIRAQGGMGGSIHLFSDRVSLIGGELNSQEHILIGDPFEITQKIFIAPSTHLHANRIQIGAEEKQAGFTSLFAPLGSLQMLSVTSNFPQTPLVDPNAGSAPSFGNAVTVLSTGKIVVTKPSDDFAASAAGAVYLYNGQTGALISTITGSTANDQIGSPGITALTGNGNYIFGSPNWDNGAVTNAGAVTWGSGLTGVSGTVSAANSLIGSTASDQVGSTSLTALTNGNYVVASQNWDRVTGGALSNVGAATWGNGTTGISGTVSVTNSLIGSTVSDQVGLSGVTALTNGNYVVASANWSRVVGGAAIKVGAATWGNGTTGISGTVSVTNSLIGSTASDQVGLSGVTALTNGNYVVNSKYWDRVTGGALGNVGASTWGDGTTGISGTVSITNSLIGSTVSDRVGDSGTTALTNGNYVVRSSLWSRVVGGAASRVGAATWGNGTTGISGTVSVTNSLIGSTVLDQVSGTGLDALTNGNYVVRSALWNRVDGGALADVGAATWGNGTTGTSGTVSVTNSLIGSTASDQVGVTGLTALTNGNYVVRSKYWDQVDGGAVADVGAATWGNGTTGTSGTVSAGNSLVGSTGNDLVSSSGVFALTNGNYVVSSPYWSRVDGGAVVSVGEVTWGNGTSGTSGTVSVNNSLIGSTANDRVSLAVVGQSVTTLTNGNYVVISYYWSRVDGGAVPSVGAATWGNGTTGTSGTISVTNSLIGSSDSDFVGYSNGAKALTNGNYVVCSERWNKVDGGAVGAVGAATWGNGATGITGTVSVTNSLIGSTLNDNVSLLGVTALTNGNYVVASSYWDWADQGLTQSGAATRGDGTTGITGTVTTDNSVLGGISSDVLQLTLDNNSAVPNTFVARFTSSFLNDPGQVIIGGDLTITPAASSSPAVAIVGAEQARIDYARSICEPFQIWEYRLFGPYLSDDLWAPLETAKRLNLILPSLVHTGPRENKIIYKKVLKEPAPPLKNSLNSILNQKEKIHGFFQR